MAPWYHLVGSIMAGIIFLGLRRAGNCLEYRYRCGALAHGYSSIYRGRGTRDV